MIFVNHKPCNEYEELQLFLARRMLSQLLICSAAFILSTPLILLGPIYAYVYKNEYSIPSGVIVPFIDPDTKNGFFLNMTIQSLAVVIGVIGVLFTEILMSILDSTVFTMKELLKYHIRTMNKKITAKTNLEGIEEELLNICRMLADLSDYVRALNELIYYKAFIQPNLSKLCVALAIFCQYVVSKLFFFFCCN